MNWTPLLLGLVGLALPATAEDDGEAFSLRHKAHERWDYVLPAERWRPVGDELELPGGLAFKTAKVGPLKLRIDTNGDGIRDFLIGAEDGYLYYARNQLAK